MVHNKSGFFMSSEDLQQLCTCGSGQSASWWISLLVKSGVFSFVHDISLCLTCVATAPCMQMIKSNSRWSNKMLLPQLLAPQLLTHWLCLHWLWRRRHLRRRTHYLTWRNIKNNSQNYFLIYWVRFSLVPYLWFIHVIFRQLLAQKRPVQVSCLDDMSQSCLPIQKICYYRMGFSCGWHCPLPGICSHKDLQLSVEAPLNSDC